MELREYVGLVAEGAIPLEEYVAEVMEEVKRVGKQYSCFTQICEERALEKAREIERKAAQGFKGKLLGVPMTVKDSICVEGVESAAGSAILRGYVPGFSATAVERAEAEGAIVVAKTAMDEFGFGTFCVNVGDGFPVPRSPVGPERCAGGSSGGCGVACAALKFPHVSIGESTGGSITSPAAFCGVAGITPTYGRVSRWGLIDYASSLDKIGAMAGKVRDAGLLLEAISGMDERDLTSLPGGLSLDGCTGSVEGLSMGLPKEFLDCADERISREVWRCAKALESEGAMLAEVSIPSVEYAVPAYYLIAASEASTHLAKFRGMLYGMGGEPEGKGFSDYFSGIRGKGFGREAKRRILLGTFARTAGYRDRYYARAAKVRAKIIGEFRQAFARFDALLAPSMPILPPTIEHASRLSPSESYALDICTVPQSLAGMPHASVPIGSAGGMPIGGQVICGHLRERTVLDVALAIERVTR